MLNELRTAILEEEVDDEISHGSLGDPTLELVEQELETFSTHCYNVLFEMESGDIDGDSADEDPDNDGDVDNDTDNDGDLNDTDDDDDSSFFSNEDPDNDGDVDNDTDNDGDLNDTDDDDDSSFFSNEDPDNDGDVDNDSDNDGDLNDTDDDAGGSSLLIGSAHDIDTNIKYSEDTQDTHIGDHLVTVDDSKMDKELDDIASDIFE